MQVLTGDGYRAAGRRAVGARRRRAAGPRPDRRRHGPPARGQPQQLGGQPSTAPCSASCPSDVREATLKKLSRVVHVPLRQDRGPHPALRPARLRAAAPAGTARRTSRSPWRATSRRRSRSRCSSSPRTTPACWRSRRACAPTPRRTASTRAHLLGYLSPITEGELDEAEKRRRHLGQRRLGRGPGRRGEGVRRVAARPARLQEGGRGLDGPGARRLRRDRVDSRATRWSPPSTPRCRPSWRSSCTRRSRPPAPPPTRSPGASTPPTAVPPSCSTRRPAGSSRWPASRPTTPRSGRAASPASS